MIVVVQNFRGVTVRRALLCLGVISLALRLEECRFWFRPKGVQDLEF